MNQLPTLQGLILYDIEKRLSILKSELNHLSASLRYKSDGKVNTKKDKPKLLEERSIAAFLKRLTRAVEVLNSECGEELREVEEFKNELSRVTNENSRKQAVRRGPWNYLHFLISWRAKMGIKAGVIAERLGELHDRLDQYLLRSNPDHPDLLRRRSEQGLVDKYLLEHVKWIHRDLVLFAVKLGANYPYEEVPATFQHWHYKYSSYQHSFTGTSKEKAGYKSWSDWKPGDSQISGESAEKFVVVSLSYWMPERLVLQPIIGHEIAHQILKDLYGFNADTGRIANDKSGIGRLYRRLTSVIEPHFVLPNNEIDKGFTHDLIRETICDVLAASRYGIAYLYAWVLEVLTDPDLATLFNDNTGFLRRFNDAVRYGEDLVQLGSREFLSQAFALKNIKPTYYYRGKVLVEYFSKLELERDQATSDFLNQVDEILDSVLDIYSEAGTDQHIADKDIARDMGSAVCQKSARQKYDKSFFLNGVTEFWQVKNSTRDGRFKLKELTLQKQVLSHPTRHMIECFLNKIPNQTQRDECLAVKFDFDNVKTINDAAWRLEWLLHVKLAFDDEYRKVWNQLRALFQLFYDDYLLRTANPHRILQHFGKNRKPFKNDESSASADVLLTRLLKGANTVNKNHLSDMYNNHLLYELDKSYNSEKDLLIQLDFVDNDLVLQWEFDRKEVADVGRFIFRPSNFQDWFYSVSKEFPQQLTLEISKIRTDTWPCANNPFDAQSPKEESQTIVMQGLLLGRYDAFAIKNKPAIEKHNASSSSSVSDSESNGLNYLSRAKKLVQVGHTQFYGDKSRQAEVGVHPDKTLTHLSALILVSSNWNGARLPTAWRISDELGSCESVTRKKIAEITGSNAERYQIDTYLSDGWEDFVICVSTKELRSASALDIVRCILNYVNGNPFIEATETLASQNCLDKLNEDRDFVRFIVSKGSHELNTLKSKIEEALKGIPGSTTDRAPAELIELFGAKDLEVRLNEVSLAKVVHGALHTAVGAKGRVETRLAWRSADASNSATTTSA